MSYKLDVIIHQLPKTTNMIGKASIWYTQKERILWRSLIGMAVGNKYPPKPLEKAFVTLIRCSSNQPDTDNLYAAAKFPIDALVFHGIVRDDKPTIMKLFCDWEKAAPKNGHIKIFVKELEAS